MKTTIEFKNRWCRPFNKLLAVQAGVLLLGLAVANSEAQFSDADGVSSDSGAKPELRLTTLLGRSWPDFVSGRPGSVAADGSYAYVGLWFGGFVIIDTSNPTNCVRLGGYYSYNSSGGAGDLAVSGGYAFFADGWNGVDVVTVTNPANPVLVARYSTNIFVSTLALSSNLLYVPSYGRFDVLTVTNPAAPTRVGGCTAPYGAPTGIAVSSGYAYVVDQSSLFVIAVTNPVTPLLVGQIKVPGTDVAVAGGYAFVAALDGTMHVISVTNPAAPVWVAGCTNYTSLYGIVITNDTVCWGGGQGLYVASITNPALPMITGVCPVSAGVQDVAISGGYAFLANASIGLQVVSISDPSRPTIVGGYRTGKSAWKVAASDDYAYVAIRDAGLRVVTVTNPEAPVVVGGYDPENFQYANGIVLANNRAYLLSYGRLDVLALTNPASPTLIGGVGLTGGASGMAIAGDYAYIAEGSVGLRIFALTNPAAPVIVGSSKLTNGYAENVVVDGGYAYTAYGVGGLQVFDVSDPSNPTWVGGHDTGGDAEGIAVSNGVAYVAARNAGVQIFSVADPANPVLLSSFGTNHDCWDVTLAGKYAYVADNYYGVQVLVVTNPAAPVRFCTLPATGPIGVSVVGSRIYVADSNNGLLIFCTAPPLQFTARVEGGTPGLPLTIETATNLTGNTVWTPLLTTNCPAEPFEFTESPTTLPQRFYRAWQAGTPNATTLTNTSQLYFDTSSIGQPRRLYRIVPKP